MGGGHPPPAAAEEASVTRTADTAADEAAIRALVAQLEAGWNAGDGDAFAAPFAADADYVVVDGAHVTGRPVIAAGHRHLLATVYRGSETRGTVEAVRFLRPDVAVARVRWRLRFDAGAGPQEAESRCQVVATREPGGWELAVFQNTPVVARTGDLAAPPGSQ
jgi:uncharacterized protein (TIGR02246 family)